MSKSLTLRASELRLRQALLTELPADIEREFLIAAEDNARELMGAIRMAAPVSDEEDRGRLKASVRILRSEDGKKVSVVAGGREAFYATFVEFGTRAMRAVPFFWPVYRLKKKRILARYKKVLARAVKKHSA